MALVDLVAEWSEAADLRGLDANELAAVVAGLCRLQEHSEGAAVRCADRSRQLEANGCGPPAEEAAAGQGRTRSLRGRDVVRASEVSEAFPALGSVIRSGRARRESIDAVVRLWRRLTPDEQQSFVDNYDDELAGLIATTSPDRFHTLVQRRGRAVRADDGHADAEAERAANRLQRTRLHTGRYRYLLEVDPLTDEELVSVVESKAWSTLNRHRDTDARSRPDEESLAEALLDLVRAGAADDRRGLPRSALISIIVDQATLRRNGAEEDVVCETEGGTAVPLGILARFACDAVTESYHLDGSGRPFDLGRRRRTASPQQRRAIRIHYGCCPLSGTPLVDCEIHHLNGWEGGGPSDYDNLVPLSRRWHHLVHDQGWTIVRTADGGLRVARPDGTHYRTIPAPTPITRRGVAPEAGSTSESSGDLQERDAA